MISFDPLPEEPSSAAVLFACDNACLTRHNAKGNLLPRLGRASFEAGYGDQLFFQCNRSHGRTPLASQHRMHCLEVSSGHVFIGITGDVRGPTDQPTTLVTQLRRWSIGLQYLWQVIKLGFGGRLGVRPVRFWAQLPGNKKTDECDCFPRMSRRP